MGTHSYTFSKCQTLETRAMTIRQETVVMKYKGTFIKNQTNQPTNQQRHGRSRSHTAGARHHHEYH